MSTLLLRDAEVDGERVDVLVAGAFVAAVEPAASLRGAELELDCSGGAVLPGLHDHHIHLLSMAAARRSVDVADDLDVAISAAHARLEPRMWMRAVGYDDGREGNLDRARLDALAPGRPVRVQHRSGAMWVLSSAALDVVGAAEAAEPGIERDAEGRPTGRVFRLDDWLRARLPAQPVPDLAAVGRELASYGMTGVTDCTPTNEPRDFATVAAAVHEGALPLTVAVTGGAALADVVLPVPLRRGPVKVVIPDHDLPALADLVELFARARGAERPVAVHCVTRAALVLALAAWREVGAADGDRVEHASVAPLELAAELRALGVAVVTQPGFIAARGDSYLREVEAEDRPDLYRCASLLAAGIEVGGSTDAPFGPADPWVAVRAAIDRRTAAGETVGPDEALAPADALALFLTPLDRPGGAARRVRPGARADLCVLDRPLGVALDAPSRDHVVATFASGHQSFAR